MIAALYIDPRGPYPRMPGVDAWDESRDARLYAGPWPVVAHPPCGPWGRLKHFCTKQDAECALRAVECVRRWGGVLEHPEHSGLWRAVRLPLPGEFADAYGGYTVEVEQVAWGHVARKRTWLYVVGVDRATVFAGMRTGGRVTHWVAGSRNAQRKGTGGVIPPGIKACSAQKRRRTPRLFAEWLVSIAQNAKGD